MEWRVKAILLNARMKKVAIAIEETLVRELSVRDQLFLFDGRTCVYDLVKEVMSVCCRDAYHYQAKKHSLRHYLEAGDYCKDSNHWHATRMSNQRALRYINDKRAITAKQLEFAGFNADGLRSSSMDDIAARLDGYKLDTFQFWEIGNVRDMRLVKAIVERRFSRKNYSAKDIERDFFEYDQMMAEKRSAWEGAEGEAAYLAYLAFQTLESKYAVEFVYRIAYKMAQLDKTELLNLAQRVTAYCGTVRDYSRLDLAGLNQDNQILFDCALINRRNDYIDEMVSLEGMELDLLLRHSLESRMAIVLMVSRMTYRGVPIQEWFNENTTVDDWVSVSRYCNYFEALNERKDFSNKKVIRNIKYIYSELAWDYKNPDIRS